MIENQLFWTAATRVKREVVIGDDKTLRQCFMATEQSLREMPYLPGNYGVDVLFTNYRLEIEVDRDRLLRITSIEVLDITKR